jgi:hypothetical protein
MVAAPLLGLLLVECLPVHAQLTGEGSSGALQ